MLVLAALAATVPSPAAALPSGEGALDTAAIDDWIEEYAARHGLPGVAVAVVKDGATVHTAATGGGPEAPVTDRTPWAVGSVAKTFTAFAVLQLVDRGELGLDDPVQRHLPELEVDDARAAGITVRHLLSHTSGLPNPALVAPAHSLREAVARLADAGLAADPGTAYSYGNPNYWVAARLVEVVSGRSFGEYLDQEVFAPLGMADTRAVVRSGPGVPGMTDGHVTAYGSAVPLREMATVVGGAGGVVSTAHDMGRWLGMQQRGGVTEDGVRLLSEDLVTEAHTRQPDAGTYGLGWQHTSTADPARIGHDGSLTRYSARVDLVPSSGYGVVVMLNSYTPTYTHPFSISTGVIEVTEGETPAPGWPVATLVDGVLGLLTLAVLGLVVLGVRRSSAWAGRRRGRPTWRFVLRLLPQLALAAAAVTVFLVLPAVDGNEATAVDAFGLWPAATVLLLVAGAGGLALTLARVRGRLRPGPGTEEAAGPGPRQASPSSASS